jgi:exosortase A
VTPQASPWVLVPLAAAAFAWLFGEMASANSIRQFALVAMVILAVPLTLGWTATRIMAFPLAYLFFCVPFGEFMLPTLIDWTADFTVSALRFTGVPVYREGTNFSIPTGNWSVVEACSGVRYLIASVMVGTLFAYLNYQSTRRRLLFVGVSILVPIIANWLRAYMIVMLGHLSNNQIATGVDHLIYGWVFFGVVILVMFMVGARWAEPEVQASVSAPVARVGASVAVALPLAVAALAVAVAALPHVALTAKVLDSNDRAVRLDLPGQVGPSWQVVAASSPVAWQPRFENASATAHAVYEKAGRKVGVYVYYYRNQDATRKLVTITNLLFRRDLDRGWASLPAKPASAEVTEQARHWRRTQLLLPAGGASAKPSLTVWQTYWVADHLISTGTLARLANAWGRLLGQGDDGAAVFLYADGLPEAGGDELVKSFVDDNLGPLLATLRAVRDAP